MSRFIRVVQQLGKGSMLIASLFLTAVMMIIVANIIYRFFGGVIAGTYELVGIFTGMAVAFALGYAALAKRHIIIGIMVSRFPERMQAIIKIFTSLISLGFWALIAWASFGIIRERLITGEATLSLKLPILPFRSIWVFGLLIFCLVLIMDLIEAFSRAVKK